MIDLMIRVKDNRETLAHLLKHQSSLARFGDGEIDVISGASIPYQDYHPDLAQSLRTILSQQSNESFLICLPDVFEKQERYNLFCRQFWEGHLAHYKSLYQEICQASWYGSTFLSRPYIDLEDKSTVGDYFTQLQALWQDRDILIVEGETSRSGVGNDLFANARTVRRIICPPRNAYSHYDWISQQILQHGQGKLVLLMLGPTAKLLAWDLAKEGLWLVDLGHIDSEYEWFKMGATSKVKLSHKHTAEFNFDTDIVFEEDQTYLGQIVADYRSKEELPLVSLIVFAQNDAPYLTECLESLSHQSYPNLEILIVDQSSTDDSDEIYQDFMTKDSRFRLLKRETENADTIEQVISEVKGDYLSILPAKDFLRRDFVAVLLEEILDKKTDLAIGNFITYKESDGLFYYYVGDKDFSIDILSPQEALNRQSVWYFNKQCFIEPWGKLYKTSLFDQLAYPSKLENISYKLYIKSERISFINRDFYTHREVRECKVPSLLEQITGWQERVLDMALAGYDLTVTCQQFQNFLENIGEEELKDRYLSRLVQEKRDFLKKADRR